MMNIALIRLTGHMRASRWQHAHPGSLFAKRQIVATIKVITFAVSKSVLEHALNTVSSLDALKLLPCAKPKTGLVQTKFVQTKSSVLDKTKRATEARLNKYDHSLSFDTRCAHETEILSIELKSLVEKNFDSCWSWAQAQSWIDAMLFQPLLKSRRRNHAFRNAS